MIQAKVQKMMEEWNMVTAGDRLLTAVSGGADSVCLLLGNAPSASAGWATRTSPILCAFITSI